MKNNEIIFPEKVGYERYSWKRGNKFIYGYIKNGEKPILGNAQGLLKEKNDLKEFIKDK